MGHGTRDAAGRVEFLELVEAVRRRSQEWNVESGS